MRRLLSASLATVLAASAAGAAQPPAAPPAEAIYFVMIDRFHNADPSNDRGGDTGDDAAAMLRHGFRPDHARWYHGGDLAGVTAKLDYIQGLGVTALWLTPVMANKPVQGDGTLDGSSAAYHGYWPLDFLNVDPHLGSGAELKRLVDEAHARGMRVYLDIVANHTADVIRYRECPRGGCSYRPLATHPDPAYTPEVPEAEANAKNPAWLNDPAHYNNRGNSTFTGEDSVHGDFFGLDDLRTRDPRVVEGMTEIYKHWIEAYGIDGFRVDTVKHVDPEFWRQVIPALRAFAAERGRPDFTVFGEVYETSPAVLSSHARGSGFPAVLDFAFQAAVRQAVAQGQGVRGLRDVFAADDLYPDDARHLPTFLGNHDMGRIGHFLRQGRYGAPDEELLRRARLAHALMFFVRGVPTIYYGDEQGFAGVGADADARQDMDPTRVPSQAGEPQIGTDATPAASNFVPDHPLYRAIAGFAALRREHPALGAGDMVLQHAGADGVLAVSRVLWRDATEYLVVFNTAAEPRTATVPSLTPGATFAPVLGGAGPATAGPDGAVAVTVPALDVAVLRADAPVADAPPGLKLVVPSFRKAVPGRAEACVQADAPSYGEVTLMLADGTRIDADRTPVSVTDSDVTACPNSRWTYRFLLDPADLPAAATLRAVWRSPSGRAAAAEGTWTAEP